MSQVTRLLLLAFYLAQIWNNTKAQDIADEEQDNILTVAKPPPTEMPLPLPRFHLRTTRPPKNMSLLNATFYQEFGAIQNEVDETSLHESSSPSIIQQIFNRAETETPAPYSDEQGQQLATEAISEAPKIAGDYGSSTILDKLMVIVPCIGRDWIERCKYPLFGCAVSDRPWHCLINLPCSKEVNTTYCIELGCMIGRQDHGVLVTYESTLAMRGISDQQFVNKTLRMRDRFMIFVTCVVKSWLEHCRYSMLICLAAPSPLRCMFQQQCNRELKPMLCVERALIHRKLAPLPPTTRPPSDENEQGEEEQSTTASPSLIDNLLNKDWDTNIDFESLVTNMSGRFFSFAICLAKDWVNHCKANGLGCILAPQPFVCLTIMECNNQVDTNYCIETALSSSSKDQESVAHTAHRPGLPRSFVDELASKWSSNKIDIIGLVKSMGAKAMKFLVCASKNVYQVCKEHVINCAFDSAPLKCVFKMNCVKLANYTQCIETALANITDQHKEPTEGVLNQEIVGQVLHEVTSETSIVEIKEITDEFPMNELLTPKPEGRPPIKRVNPLTPPSIVKPIQQTAAPTPPPVLISRTTPTSAPALILRTTPSPSPALVFRAPPPQVPPYRKKESVLPLVRFGVVNNLLHKLSKK